MQYFEVLKTRKDVVHSDKVIQYIVGIFPTLTEAMAVQAKNIGSVIKSKVYAV
jgi:hypothetical protein